ncbi:acyl-CoA dehydrogenase family protein [Lentzea sp. NBRC 102530]|uniref:acyl-CoA dehydrogenase family protein n=1 Tax=Lentzea sp. NBRC 102530 TaxID=3032201 RepID=UPI0024A02252|nr:acyl-CoA dehydrogenase family protein [Lentzea sp. NBRC 102530]GLY46781.1 hypothetical protein Lesp01_04370 [Lentzea sp. NBRC 102530]
MVEKIEACEGGHVYDPSVRWIADTGWIGMSVPREYGGQGLGHLAWIVSIEETSRLNAAAGNTLQSGSLGTAMVVGLGDESQCERWLPDFAPAMAGDPVAAGRRRGRFGSSIRRAAGVPPDCWSPSARRERGTQGHARGARSSRGGVQRRGRGAQRTELHRSTGEPQTRVIPD